MGVKIFGVDIQNEIAKAIGPGKLPPVTLRKYTPGTRNSGNLSGGLQRTSADYVTRGVMTEYTERPMSKDVPVQAGDKFVMMIAKPLADLGIVPQVGDEVIIEGTTLRVVFVERDPATAAYRCQCRG